VAHGAAFLDDIVDLVEVATTGLGSGLGREANEAYNDFVSQRGQLMGRSALVVP